MRRLRTNSTPFMLIAKSTSSAFIRGGETQVISSVDISAATIVSLPKMHTASFDESDGTKLTPFTVT